MGNKLQNIEGFINYISLCNINNKKYILVMNYYKEGCIKKYDWTVENIYILKSLLKQCIISILKAYKKYGFIHNDLHFGNILIDKKEKEEIYYQGYKIYTFGYEIVIMDVGKSFNNLDKIDGNTFYWTKLLNLFDRLKFDLIGIQPKYFDINVDKYIKKASIKNYIPDKSIELFDLIDSMEFMKKDKDLKFNNSFKY